MYLWCFFVVSLQKLLNKQLICQSFETPWPLCDATVLIYLQNVHKRHHQTSYHPFHGITFMLWVQSLQFHVYGCPVLSHVLHLLLSGCIEYCLVLDCHKTTVMIPLEGKTVPGWLVATWMTRINILLIPIEASFLFFLSNEKCLENLMWA